MSFSETIFLFFLALVIFGPKKLPEIARQVGKALNEFKRASNEFRAQIEQEIAHLEVENKQTILPPTQAPEHSTSRSRYAGTEIDAAAEAPALTASGSDGAPVAGESSPGEGASSHTASGEASLPDQASPAASDTSENVTASDPAATSAAPEPHIPDSLAPESHA